MGMKNKSDSAKSAKLCEKASVIFSYFEKLN